MWVIEFPSCKEFFTLNISQPATEGRNLAIVPTASTVDGLRIFRTFSKSFTTGDKITMLAGESDKFDMSVVDQELARLKELNSFESGLQLAI